MDALATSKTENSPKREMWIWIGISFPLDYFRIELNELLFCIIIIIIIIHFFFFFIIIYEILNITDVDVFVDMNIQSSPTLDYHNQLE